jgi:hypothetical protein
MFAVVLLTFLIGFIAIRTRFTSIRLRQINIGYFKLMQAKISREVPERVIVTSRCFNNMFEIPVLFYAAGITGMALDQITPFSVIVAWLFVLSRCIHTWIHLTYNNLKHRMHAFWIGMALVLALWIEQVLISL